ncbi:MAG: hypothetical protein ABS68_06255 [Niastella sp. SCN 39-18]|nr:hypothetical protein [Sphingobacteriales bacterium]ODT53327.1 MAG: hypothetical protein ABS68_06255 [Niastella sp. SCN 39-18]OJW08592.1 MAG: hypothetical protein BGO53_10210 [Sphingobacteriales bacterium 39-19]
MNMKNNRQLLLLVTAICLSLSSFAQSSSNDDGNEKKSGFKKENLFTGGTANISFFNGATMLGVSPFLGYSLNKWLDVAISGNINYISQRDYQVYGDKARQTIYGPGAFLRIFPVKFLFLQAHYEYNFINFKYLPAANSGYQEQKEKLHASSFLIGGGYSGGRDAYNKSFYYISVLFDVAKDKNSPYADGLGRVIPQIRAGYNIALFQHRK